MTLPFTGERYVPSVRGQIAYEHLHRYALASRYAAGKRVLDVASGEGYGAALLARVAATVVGVDADAASVEHGRHAYYASNLRFVQGSCSELPIAAGSFDVVVSFETIEHVAEHDRMLDEVRRVLVPGGVLVLSSPNKLTYSDLPGYANPFHVKELYFSELRDLLVRRFANVRIFGQRLAALSLVHPLAGETSAAPAWYNGAADRVEAGLPTVEAPLYFIAVASDGELDADLSSAFIDPHDDVLQHIWDGLDGLRAAVAQPLETESRVTAIEAPQVEGSIDQDGHDTDQPVPERSPAAEDEAQEQAELRAQQQAEFQAQQAELRAQQQAEAQAQQAELQAQQARLAQAEERARALAEELEQVRRQAAASADAEARLAEESLRARTLRATADELNAELVRARAETQATAAEAAVERERAAQAARELSALRSTAAAEQAQRAAATAELAAALDAARRENAARREAARTTETEHAGLKDELGALGGRLASTEAALHQTEAALSASQAALARAEQDSTALREILSSRSWKMTEPLRRAVSLVRR